jgi:hypothetical protein
MQMHHFHLILGVATSCISKGGGHTRWLHTGYGPGPSLMHLTATAHGGPGTERRGMCQGLSAPSP